MRTITNILLATLVIIGFASCDKDTSIAELTLDSSSLAIDKGEIAKITVETGNGKYKAISSNNLVAKVAVSGTTIAILGVEGGVARVTITDEQGKEKTIDVTVSYKVPGGSTFIWNKESTEFDKAGTYGISILSSSVALTDFNVPKQFVLSWDGGMTEGEKTNGQLVIAEPGLEVKSIALSSIQVVLSTEARGYVVFNDGTRRGELLFSK